MNQLKPLLPWNKNNSLSEKETFSESELLRITSEADLAQEKFHKIEQAVRSQEMQTPSPQVLIKLFAEIDQFPKNRKVSNSWIWGIPVMLLIFSLLWLVLQPGNQLQWIAHGNQPVTFRIYRAPAGTMEFKLIEELPVSPDQQTYQFTDSYILPWQAYQYLIEVRDQSGNTITSSVAIQNTWISLVTQITILLTGFMLTFGIITIAQEKKYSVMLNSTVSNIFS